MTLSHTDSTRKSGAALDYDAPHAIWAAHYIENLDFKLARLLPGQKKPVDKAWNTEPRDPVKGSGYFTDSEEARRHFTLNPHDGMGAVHGPSGTGALDIDYFDWARSAFAAVDLSLDEILEQAAVRIVGNPERDKALYHMPEGLTLVTHALVWPDPEKPSKEKKIFELRAGAVQDVLPPSVHPETQQPYRFRGPIPQTRDDISLLPPALRMVWENWSALLPKMQAACPWRIQEEAKRQARRGGAAIGWDQIREEIKAHLTVPALLARMGQEVGRDRKIRCLFHDDHDPSMHCYDEHYYCYGCNTFGDVISLYAKWKNVTQEQATAALAQELEIEGTRNNKTGKAHARGQPYMNGAAPEPDWTDTTGTRPFAVSDDEIEN